MSYKTILRLSLTAVLFVSTIFLFAGCESGTNTGSTTTTDNTQLSVSVTPRTVGIDETAVVEATVSAGGVGVADAVVRFTVSPTGAGFFTPEYDTTGSDGIAACVFTASTDGNAVITATLEGTTMTSNLGVSITDDTTGGSSGTSGSVNVSISDNLLLADGEDTTRVTIVVRDAFGQPAPESTLVQVTAGEKFVDKDSNGYWSAGIDSLVYDRNDNGQWDPMGIIPSNAWTEGATGTAHVTYTAGEESGTAYIKVTVNAVDLRGSVDVPVQLSPNASLSFIYLATDDIKVSVRGTGGMEITNVKATGYDINGNPVPEGMTIVFSILDGPGGGEQLDTLGNGPDTATTNGSGIATTTLHSGTVSGTVRIRAFADTVLSNATQVLIAAGPPARIEVGAEFCNVKYWRTVGKEVEVGAVVSDIYNNPVNDSTVVYFTVDEGVIVATQARTQDGMGIVTTKWLSGQGNPGADGKVIVTAETGGGTVTDQVGFINSYIPAVISVSNWQSSILADGEMSFEAVVSAVDLNGNFVVSGTDFQASATFLSVAGGTFEDGCESSSGTAKVTSRTLKKDHSITGAVDDGIGAIDAVIYRHTGGASVTMPIQLLTDYAYSGNSSISGDATMAPGETIYMSATIKDRNGNPLGRHTLHFTVGIEDLGTYQTNAYGEVTGITWTAPGLEGKYVVVCQDTDPRGGIVLTHSVDVANN